MKLRNRKTGEIEAVQHNVALLHFSSGKTSSYHSIVELNEEWEDYKTQEPLIKDEKIRKAVRAWAEACNVERCQYDGDGDFATRWHGIKLDGSGMELDEGHYTIAELCGEEEE